MCWAGELARDGPSQGPGQPYRRGPKLRLRKLARRGENSSLWDEAPRPFPAQETSSSSDWELGKVTLGGRAQGTQATRGGCTTRVSSGRRSRRGVGSWGEMLSHTVKDVEWAGSTWSARAHEASHLCLGTTDRLGSKGLRFSDWPL